MARRISPPSTQQYPKGLRAGKILMGRRCNPVFMEQEGTHAGGRSPKRAPAPWSGMNANNARVQREARAEDPHRLTATQQQSFRMLLSVFMQDLDAMTKAVVGPVLRQRAARLVKQGIDARQYIAHARSLCTSM